jgi:hypothetical protein
VYDGLHAAVAVHIESTSGRMNTIGYVAVVANVEFEEIGRTVQGRGNHLLPDDMEERPHSLSDEELQQGKLDACSRWTRRCIRSRSKADMRAKFSEPNNSAICPPGLLPK